MKKRRFEGIGEELREAELPNGLRLRVIPKPGFRSVYTVLAVRFGGAHRRFRHEGAALAAPAGLAHYLEHKSFDLPEGDTALETLSANGVDPNAFTSTDMTAYYFECDERFEENLRLFLHLVSTPHFTAENVEKERGIITQEILEGEDDPYLTLYYRFLCLLYAGHPIRERLAGTVESIREITAETLADFFRLFYTPANMVLCVEGDVDPDAVERIAREELDAARAAVPAPDPEEEDLLPVGRRAVEQAPVSAPQFLLGAKLRPAPSGEEALRLHLTATLALRTAFGRSSPFYNRLYASGLLNRDYACEADFTAGAAMVLMGGESPDPDAVLAELRREVAAIAEQGLDEARFQRARRASLGARLRGLEDFETVCLATAEGVFEGYCSLDSFALLESVSRADCEAFLLDALRPERLAIAIYEPKKD